MIKTKYLATFSFVLFLIGLSLTIIGITGILIGFLTPQIVLLILLLGIILDIISFIFIYISYRQKRTSLKEERIVMRDSEKIQSEKMRGGLKQDLEEETEEAGTEIPVKTEKKKDISGIRSELESRRREEVSAYPSAPGGRESSEEEIRDFELLEETKEEEPELIFKKHISVEYYDFMNPEKNYPMNVNLSDIEQKTIEEKENLLTGEHKTQLKDKMEIKVVHPTIKVHPILPGCIITPTILSSDLLKDIDELKFYVTPIAKGKLEGYIDFLDDEGKIIHYMPINAQVEDPRLARSIAIYGSIASVVPKALLFFGIQMEEIITNIIALIGVLFTFLLSFFIFKIRQPKKTRQIAELK